MPAQLNLLPSAGRKISNIWCGLLLLTGAVVCLLAAPRVQLLVSVDNE